MVDGQDIYACQGCAREPWLYDALGHSAPPDGRAFWTENLVTGAPMTLCPIRTLQLAAETDPGLVHEVRTYWTRYEPLFREHGLLLVAGGMADQPARFWSFLEEIGRLREQMAETFARLRPPSAPAMGGA